MPFDEVYVGFIIPFLSITYFIVDIYIITLPNLIAKKVLALSSLT